jgi:hypothetical protein
MCVCVWVAYVCVRACARSRMYVLINSYDRRMSYLCHVNFISLCSNFYRSTLVGSHSGHYIAQ